MANGLSKEAKPKNYWRVETHIYDMGADLSRSEICRRRCPPSHGAVKLAKPNASARFHGTNSYVNWVKSSCTGSSLHSTSTDPITLAVRVLHFSLSHPMRDEMRPAFVTVTLILSAVAIVLLEFGTQHQLKQQHPNPIPQSLSSPKPASMDSDSDVLHRFIFFNVLKDGRVNFFYPPTRIIPPADDPLTGVKIKDAQISSDVSARVFLPPLSADEKLPVMLYVHGGAFCMQSAFNAIYTPFVADLTARARIIAVSVEYGLFPARPIPACYDDSWEALRWIASHSNGSGPDPWLNEHADLKRLFLAGDSAGANICHTLANRTAAIGLPGGVTVEGMIMIHPYFGENDKMWMYMCPTNEGPMDRRMKAAPEDMARLACRRMVVIVAEKDMLREAGVKYVEELRKSGWKGSVELVENEGREHCFFLDDHRDREAVANMRRMVNFIHHSHQD
ncbi:hypothetical protein Cgig2_032436 [Carnegiea gigantea]|uniref:Alpha/beta hydrolase fold-3 domain-containing protein n=1 Tax=Carnegiea gigantea TaxID=171969 RepID=A0A9Q1QRB5_9CARY|nr:hypothetical protein Cgig2_032436 [Carnegiea gigantea]